MAFKWEDAKFVCDLCGKRDPAPDPKSWQLDGEVGGRDLCADCVRSVGRDPCFCGGGCRDVVPSETYSLTQKVRVVLEDMATGPWQPAERDEPRTSGGEE